MYMTQADIIIKTVFDITASIIVILACVAIYFYSTGMYHAGKWDILAIAKIAAVFIFATVYVYVIATQAALPTTPAILARFSIMISQVISVFDSYIFSQRGQRENDNS